MKNFNCIPSTNHMNGGMRYVNGSIYFIGGSVAISNKVEYCVFRHEL